MGSMKVLAVISSNEQNPEKLGEQMSKLDGVKGRLNYHIGNDAHGNQIIYISKMTKSEKIRHLFTSNSKLQRKINQANNVLIKIINNAKSHENHALAHQLMTSLENIKTAISNDSSYSKGNQKIKNENYFSASNIFGGSQKLPDIDIFE